MTRTWPVATDQHLRELVLAATTAPSVHNTQPWSFRLTRGRIELRADRRRQLSVLDPTGRQLTISCGCALFNLRAAAAAAGFRVRVDRFPAHADPDRFASIEFEAPSVQPEPEQTAPEDDVALLASYLRRRHTNRRHFEPAQLPDATHHALELAAAAEGAALVDVATDADRGLVEDLTARADRALTLIPSYRAELRAWTTNDPLRADGVSAATVPRVMGAFADDLPIRDFDTHGDGGLPADTASTSRQTLVILCTDDDSDRDWLRAGEALERVWLEISAAGWSASPFTQPIEVAPARLQLRSGLALTGYPHLVLRIGRAAPTSGSPRRPVGEVITD